MRGHSSTAIVGIGKGLNTAILNATIFSSPTVIIHRAIGSIPQSACASLTNSSVYVEESMPRKHNGGWNIDIFLCQLRSRGVIP